MNGAAPGISRNYLHAMDETVAEIFSAMLQIECSPTPPAEANHEVAARIGFSGTLEGVCVVSFTGDAAASLAQAFLGVPADDSMIDDAVGELCNMLAGAWKRRLGSEASVAGITVPAVTRGPGCCPDEPHSKRSYEFSGTPFTVLLCIAATPLEQSRYLTTLSNNGEDSRLANSLSEDE